MLPFFIHVQYRVFIYYTVTSFFCWEHREITTQRSLNISHWWQALVSRSGNPLRQIMKMLMWIFRMVEWVGRSTSIWSTFRHIWLNPDGEVRDIEVLTVDIVESDLPEWLTIQNSRPSRRIDLTCDDLPSVHITSGSRNLCRKSFSTHRLPGEIMMELGGVHTSIRSLHHRFHHIWQTL